MNVVLIIPAVAPERNLHRGCWGFTLLSTGVNWGGKGLLGVHLVVHWGELGRDRDVWGIHLAVHWGELGREGLLVVHLAVHGGELWVMGSPCCPRG